MALHEVLTAVDRIEQEALAAAVEGLAAELAEPGRRAVDALEAAAEAAGPMACGAALSGCARLLAERLGAVCDDAAGLAGGVRAAVATLDGADGEVARDLAGTGR